MSSSGDNRGPTGPGFVNKLKHAFAAGEEYEEKLLEDEERLLKDIAANIHARRLTSAAIPFLLFHKPLNVVGANFVQMGELVFTMGPIETFLRRFLGPSYTHERLVRTLEKRCSIDRLVELLEALIDGRPGPSFAEATEGGEECS